MPELPEVETVVRDLRAAGVVGRRIARVFVGWPGSVSGFSVSAFRNRLTGRTVQRIDRRGKYIVAELSGGWTLLVHLRMTGQFRLAAAGALRDRHEHVALTLDDGRELRYRDTRKFGRWYVVRDAAERLGALGPEPLDPFFSADALRRAIHGRKAILKPLLLDQRVIAGLGNIYVDEALWESMLHPMRSTATLREEEIRRLHRAIRTVLRRGIQARGTTLGYGKTNFRGLGDRAGRNQRGLQVFRRTGQPCRRCGMPIERLIVGQRSTHVCPRCQPARGG